MRILVVAVSCVLLLCGCSGDAKVGGVDPGAAGAAHAAEGGPALVAVRSTFSELMKSMASLQDPAKAEQAKVSLQQQLGKLQQQVGELDAKKLGTVWTTAKAGLGKLADEQLTKYRNDPEMQKTIGPVLEQLKALFRGD